MQTMRSTSDRMSSFALVGRETGSASNRQHVGRSTKPLLASNYEADIFGL